MATETRDKKLYLIDGTAQLFRAYFAIGGLTNDEGLPTNAIYGFTTMLRKLIGEERPPYLGVAFDLGGPVFRHETFEEYKANRPPAPEDLRVQIPYARQICEVLEIPVLELSGFEADDLIATCATRARREGFEVVVVSSDKDLLQLVGDGITVLNPNNDRRLDPAGVEESFGVPPERVRDVLGLMGDSVDNVPGVPGVGRKTALAAVSTYGDVEAVIGRAERFVAAYDARDALVAAIEKAAAEATLAQPTVESLDRAAVELDEAARALIEIESDPEMRERLESLTRLLKETDLGPLSAEVGRPGRRSVRFLGPLKRELKGLDRKSSKRIWYAVAEHAEQARLSKELVTLHHEAAIEFEPDRFAWIPPAGKRVRDLFESLGFQSLLGGFERVEAPPGVETGAEAATSRVLTKRAELEKLATACRKEGRMAIVVVADGADAMSATLVGIGLSCREGEGCYVPVGHEGLAAGEQPSAAEVTGILGPLFADPRVAKVGRSLKRDAHVLRRFGSAVEGWELDVAVAAFLLNSSRTGYSLAELTGEFLAAETRGLEPPGSDEIDRVGAAASEEAEATLRLSEVLLDRLDEAGLADLYRTIDGPLVPLLVEMEAWGIRVDTGLLEGMSREMEQVLDRTRADIHALAGAEFNVDSPKQLREILFDRLGLKPRRKTAKAKAASTDARTLEELASEHAIAGKILEYRELAKLKGTYVDALPRLVHPETGRVHTSFHPTGAATGRLSSSDPNLQNIPARTETGRKIRAAFVPDPGYVFLASDYSQIELRVLAHLTGDPELTAAFHAGEDIHRHTASRVFDVPPDLVSGDMRRRAKAVNFGILYGMSESRLAREQGMSRKEAREFIEAYFDRFENVGEYIDEIREQARRDAAVRTMFGRIRRFPQLHQQVNRAVQEQALRAAVNTTIQGTAADLMKMAMLRVREDLGRSGHDARILLQVHDELLLEVAEEAAREVGELVRGAMERVHPLDVPLVVDQKTGRNWLETT